MRMRKTLQPMFFSKKNNEFSNSRRKYPKKEGDRQQAEANVLPKNSNKSTEIRNGFIYQEHEDLIIVLNIHRTKGSPLPPPFSSPISNAKPRRMKMGMGGAVNGITNSILIKNDNLSICALSFMKRTIQYALVLLVPSCELLQKVDGLRITRFSTLQWSKLS